MAPYASSDPQLESMAGGDPTRVATALEAGAYRIDAAFAQAGFAVPIDTTVITNVEAKARFDAQLEVTNRAIAAYHLSRGSDSKRGQPTRVEKDYREAIDWLDMVVSGKAADAGVLPELPENAGINAGFAIAGDYKFGITDDFLEAKELLF